MKTLVIASQKGGAGKSTLARAFAVAALIDGRRVALIDGDPQGTVRKWAARRPTREGSELLVLSTKEDRLPALVRRAEASGADFVVIDTAPHLRAEVSIAAEAADGVLIPVRPSPDDLEAIGDTVAMIRAGGRQGAIVLNAAPSRTSALEMARAALTVFGLPVLAQALMERTAHPYAAAQGLTAQEYEPQGKAAAEVAEAWRQACLALPLDF